MQTDPRPPAPLGIIGQNRHGVATILNLTVDLSHVRKLKPSHAELAPAPVPSAEHNRRESQAASGTMPAVVENIMKGLLPSDRRAPV